jgi:hypothetical protein
LIAELVARRRWLITGIVVAILASASRFVSIGILPPSITPKHLSHATATTQLLVGQRFRLGASMYRDNSATSATLRAQALADIMSSPEVRSLIARQAGIPAGDLAVDTPVWTNVERIQQWPSREKRDSQIVLETAPFRITVDVEDSAPIIDIATQAPTSAQAAALASGAGKGLSAYVSQLQHRTRTPAARRYSITPLVPIGVSPESKSALVNVAAFTFAAVLFMWCGAMLFLPRLADDVRAVRQRAKVSNEADRSSSDGPAPPDPTGVLSASTMD